MRREHGMSDAARDALAAAAYAIWRERMALAALADADDPGAAIRQYSELTALERDRIASWIALERIPDQLFEAVRRALVNRELVASDLKTGALVRPIDEHSRESRLDQRPIGQVIDWEAANPQTGRLNSIRVRWDSGQIETHAACELELVQSD